MGSAAPGGLICGPYGEQPPSSRQIVPGSTMRAPPAARAARDRVINHRQHQPVPLAISGRIHRLDDHGRALCRADHTGLGIGVVQVPVGERGLVRVLPELVIQHLDTWIVAHEDLRRSARIGAVFRHLVDSLRHYCGSHQTII